MAELTPTRLNIGLPDSVTRSPFTDTDTDFDSPLPSPSPVDRRFSHGTGTASLGSGISSDTAHGQRSALGVGAGGVSGAGPSGPSGPSTSAAGLAAASLASPASLAAPSSLVTPAGHGHHPRRVSAIRPSFSTMRGSMRRVSRAPEWDEDAPKLPTLVPGIRPAYSTPLPMLPMGVLCLAMLSELLSANLSQPFMLKMVERFFLDQGVPPGSELEAAVGLWTGNLVSVFYITQFFTSLLWSSIADRHGRRAVLVASMAGSGLSLLMFGTSTSLPEAICVRLIQGIFAGAIGVFRGSIRDITDDTNATRAYAILGFCWGLGGVVGPIIGGLFQDPSDNYPGTWIGNIKLFQRLPYLLPTIMGGSIMFFGALLACFLSWDGGVRGGSRITLEVEKDEPLVPGSRAGSVSPQPAHRNSVAAASAVRIPANNNLFSPDREDQAGTSALGTSHRHAAQRRDSLASLGTAYGYGGIRSKHPTLAARRAIEAARRASAVDGGQRGPEGDRRSVSLATKLLLANEDNTFNINDLWLSAAVAQDTAVFDDDDEYDEEFGESRIDPDIEDDYEEDMESLAEEGTPLHSTVPDSSPRQLRMFRTFSTTHSGPSRHRAASGGSELRGLFRRQSTVSRRYSNSSNVVPSIFSNTGLTNTPGIALPLDDEADVFSPAGTNRRGAPPGLTAISEQNTTSPVQSDAGTMAEVEKDSSRWKLLPLLVIVQYGLLSCHDSTHGQIFLSFIISPPQSGGVGISPAHYSYFVAIMCVGQLIYQFYLFPRMGPPLGPFNHLQMFRIGCALYVPGYLLVPLLHFFASDNGGGVIVMTLMSLISAIRYCGGTFAYTSIMILINAMTPPHLVGLANGLAQSTVSCARFFGPALGGAIWSASIAGNPGGYARGFFTVALMALIQVLGSFMIR